MAKAKHTPGKKMIGAIALFVASGFFLLALKNMDIQSLIMAFVVPLIFLASSALIPKVFRADSLLLSLVNLLCSLGVLVLYRISPDKGINQAINYGAGVLAMILCMLAIRHLSRFKTLLVIVAGGALVLMALPVVIGREVGGAKAWIALGGLNFQPSELVKVVLVVVNAYLLSKRKVLLSIIFTGICLVFLLLQKDLGTALLYFIVSLLMMYVSTGSFALLGAGFGGAAAAGILGYSWLKSMGFAHIDRRITAWTNPWGNYENEGFQTVQSLLAIVNGGLFGLGLGAGNASKIPVRETDSIFPFIVNEFGIILGICLIVLYIIIFIRGIGISSRCNHRFHSLLAMGCSLFIAFQTFVIIGGNINLIPITGVTLPFISYGGTSLLSSLCLIGLLQGIESINEDHIAQDAKMATMGDELP